MSKTYVRILNNYGNVEKRGAKAILLEVSTDIYRRALIGFPLGSKHGWYDPNISTDYQCWWIPGEYLEPVQVFRL